MECLSTLLLIFRVKCSIIFHLSKVFPPIPFLLTKTSTWFSIPALASGATLRSWTISGTSVATACRVVLPSSRAWNSFENRVTNALRLLGDPGLNPIVLASFSLSDNFRGVRGNLRLCRLWLHNGWSRGAVSFLIATLVFEVELVAVRAIDRDALLLSTRPEPFLNAFTRA